MGCFPSNSVVVVLEVVLPKGTTLILFVPNGVVGVVIVPLDVVVGVVAALIILLLLNNEDGLLLALKVVDAGLVALNAAEPADLLNIEN